MSKVSKYQIYKISNTPETVTCDTFSFVSPKPQTPLHVTPFPWSLPNHRNRFPLSLPNHRNRYMWHLFPCPPKPQKPSHVTPFPLCPPNPRNPLQAAGEELVANRKPRKLSHVTKKVIKPQNPKIKHPESENPKSNIPHNKCLTSLKVITNWGHAGLIQKRVGISKIIRVGGDTWAKY